jgi:hypothetical protein
MAADAIVELIFEFVGTDTVDVVAVGEAATCVLGVTVSTGCVYGS